MSLYLRSDMESDSKTTMVGLGSHFVNNERIHADNEGIGSKYYIMYGY